MTTDLSATLLIDFSKFRVRLHKKTLAAMGKPEHILLMVNPNDKTIAIMQGTSDSPAAHHLNYKLFTGGRCVEIYSRSFVKKLLDVNPEWKEKNSYRLTGQIIPGKSIALYSMIGAEELRTNKAVIENDG